MTTTIKGEQVKALRQRTGAGIMDCKQALEASGGNLELAIEELRKLGRAKASKKAYRLTHEGRITIETNEKQAAMLEVNSETDFVARTDEFIQFVNQAVCTVLQHQVVDPYILLQQSLTHSSLTVEAACQELSAKTGEKILIRRIALSNPATVLLGTYVHRHRIGVIVELDVIDKELAKNILHFKQAISLTDEWMKTVLTYQELARNIAMHIAASHPQVIVKEHMSQQIIEKEKEIYFAQAANSGKPKEVIEKMVQGRLDNFLNEASLLGQTYIKEPEMTVGNLLSKYRAKVTAFYRLEIGEETSQTTSAQLCNH